eukprot:sb/3476977/
MMLDPVSVTQTPKCKGEHVTSFNPLLTIFQTTICQYNIDVTEPEELEDNCDLVLCFKDLNLDDGDFIKINHRDLQGGDTLKLVELVHISTSQNTPREVRSSKFEVSRTSIFG